MTSSYTSALRSPTQKRSCRSCSRLKSTSQGLIQNKLLVNDLKAEFIVIVSPQQEGKFTIPGIHVGDSLILPTNQAHNLGVVFKKHLNIQAQINSICHSAYLHLCNIGQVCSVLSEVTRRLIHAFITSYVDCCNTLLDRVGQSLTDKLQWILNSAARILMLTYTQVCAYDTCAQGAVLAPCVCSCGLQEPGPHVHSPAQPQSTVSPQFAAAVPAWLRSPLLAQQSAVCAQDKTQDIWRQDLSPPSTYCVELAAPSRSHPWLCSRRNFRLCYLINPLHRILYVEIILSDVCSAFEWARDMVPYK